MPVNFFNKRENGPMNQKIEFRALKLHPCFLIKPILCKPGFQSVANCYCTYFSLVVECINSIVASGVPISEVGMMKIANHIIE
jgi:hypothetical protein